MPCFFAYEAEKISEEYGGLYTVGSKPDLKAPPLPYEDHYLCSFFDPCKNTCLDLYREWTRQRLEKKRDDYYRFLIEDSYSSHKIALMNFKALGLGGYVVEVEGKVQAYTLGYRLNREVYVILFEIANLNLKGISQFIFREFCRGLNGYKFINTLGHCGLENLKRVKDSYQPIKKEAVFTARKQP